MTWRELIERIPENKLDTEVTIYDDTTNEYTDQEYPMSNFGWDEVSINNGGFYITF